MPSDLEIAHDCTLKPISEIAHKLNLSECDYDTYGPHIAKIKLNVLEKTAANPKGKLILVTTINPTPAGEGKTTTTIGLAQALTLLGKKTSLAIREPSLGPMMGIKGGATGGGKSQVVPMEDINLHFTGDMHAITSAHNLLASLLDNHIHHGDEYHIDPRYIVWPRVLDISDRALRNTVIGLGGPTDGVPHQTQFAITPASEIMAILCLSKNLADLKERLSRIIVAYTYDNKPITAADLDAVGAMAVLLKDAIKPNLVQTLEGTPAFIHGGPFANIAHGTNSIISTQLALQLSDYVITEAGFGSDLGAEKYFNIVCPTAGFTPDACVIVVTTRSLKHNGGGDGLSALKIGLDNLDKHIDNVKSHGVPLLVAINEFSEDLPEEIDCIISHCKDHNIPVASSTIWSEGGEGGVELAGQLVSLLHNTENNYHPLYDHNLPIKDKIQHIATQIYGADRVVYTVNAEKDIALAENLGLDNLPICVAKTASSLSDDPKLLGRPSGFKITVRQIRFSAGAGFLVALTGKITTMPGLPKKPASAGIDLHSDGSIIGLH